MFGYNTDKILDSIFDEDLQRLRDIHDAYANGILSPAQFVDRINELYEMWDEYINEQRKDLSTQDA